MSVGWLIFFNIAVIPFLVQAEEEGLSQRRFPSFWRIILLSRVRRQRWFFGYLLLAILFFMLAIVPTSSGKVYIASTAMIGAVLVLQVLLWGFVAIKIKNLKKGENNGAES